VSGVQSLQIENLAVSYGDSTVLEALDLTLAAGDVRVVLGPNGAGKSTLFNAIAGTVSAKHGSIRVGGMDVTHMPAHRRARAFIGRSFQIPKLAPELTGSEHMLLASRVRADDAWGIGELAGRRVEDMTHSERKIIEVASALALRAPILLLDEPSAGADTATKEQLLSRLADIGMHSTTLIIEHDTDFIARLALPIVLLSGGRISCAGGISEVRTYARSQGIYF
jgi:ABC-type branched-subunit amino acid transport system ATPase component